MGWEQRGRHRYFYVVRRLNGRVRKEYMGRGPAAVAAAEQVAVRKADRAAEQERRESELVLADQVAAIGAEANTLLEAALLAAGFHRPQRKPWRKRRSRRI
jgi:hypothetical protein